MKKIITTTGQYGPFESVEIAGDHYICDGAVLPFSVVGVGTVSDWTDELPAPDPVIVAPPVPDSIDSANGLIVLHHAGLLDAIKTIVAGASVETQILFERRTTWQRDNADLKQTAADAGISDSELDQLFIAAAGL